MRSFSIFRSRIFTHVVLKRQIALMTISKYHPLFMWRDRSKLKAPQAMSISTWQMCLTKGINPLLIRKITKGSSKAIQTLRMQWRVHKSMHQIGTTKKTRADQVVTTAVLASRFKDYRSLPMKQSSTNRSRINSKYRAPSNSSRKSVNQDHH